MCPEPAASDDRKPWTKHFRGGVLDGKVIVESALGQTHKATVGFPNGGYGFQTYVWEYLDAEQRIVVGVWLGDSPLPENCSGAARLVDCP